VRSGRKESRREERRSRRVTKKESEISKNKTKLLELTSQKSKSNFLPGTRRFRDNKKSLGLA
jgi:hypothetical protein